MAEPRTVRENANTLSSVQIAEILPHRSDRAERRYRLRCTADHGC